MKTLDLGSDNSKYLRLVEGQNKIRVVSDAIPVYTLFNREEKSAQKWLDEASAPTSNPDLKRRFAFWCLDRADGKIKMAELGVSIMKQIQKLAQDDDYGYEGEIAPYDVKIAKEGSGMETSYSVTPSPVLGLTDEEKDRVSKLESVFDFMRKEPGVVSTVDLNQPPF